MKISLSMFRMGLIAPALIRPDTRADCIRVSVMDVWKLYIEYMG
jgi:hypothetical protein